MPLVGVVEDIVKSIVGEVVSGLNEELQGEYQFKTYMVFTEKKDNDLSIEIDLGYVIHLMEISEAVSEGFNEHIADIESELGRELTEEEIEEEWNRIYEDELEELNSEYVYPVEGEIKYNLSETYPFYSGELRVEITPLFCDGDYCDVGSDIRIVFENIRIETIEKASDKFKEFLADLLRLIHSIITL